jgi:hypothetical protein
LNDKVAEGGAEIECLEYRVGVTAGQKTVGNVGRKYGWWRTRAATNETTHQVFPNFTGSKKKSERARILLETQIKITYIL